MDDGYREKAQDNAKRLRGEIEKLNSKHRDFTFSKGPFIKFKEFWDHSREMTELFKTLKPLLKEDREELWASFRTICDNTKRKENEERDRFFYNSKEKKELAWIDMNEAYHYGHGAQGKKDIESANFHLQKALARLKDTTVRLTKEHSQECWDKYNEALRAIRYRREELQELSYENLRGIAYDVLTLSKINPFDAGKKMKYFFERLKEGYINKEQREDLMKIIDEAREHMNYKFEELRKEKERKQKEWEERQRERERKQKEWEERQRERERKQREWEEKKKEWERNRHERIDRLRGVLDGMESSRDKQEEYARRVESQIDDLKDKKYDARGSYADRLEDWISEKEDKLYDVRNNLRSLEDKIDSVRTKLDDLESRG